MSNKKKRNHGKIKSYLSLELKPELLLANIPFESLICQNPIRDILKQLSMQDT